MAVGQKPLKTREIRNQFYVLELDSDFFFIGVVNLLKIRKTTTPKEKTTKKKTNNKMKEM